MITSYMYTNVGGRKVNEDSCITLEDGKENAEGGAEKSARV